MSTCRYKPNQLLLPGCERPKRKRRKLMHVYDAGEADGIDGGVQIVRFRCHRCEHTTDWISIPTLTEARRGIPCPNCNKESLNDER